MLIFVELFLQELMSDGHVRNCQTTSKEEDERYGQFIAVANVEWQILKRRLRDKAPTHFSNPPLHIQVL